MSFKIETKKKKLKLHSYLTLENYLESDDQT